MIASIIFSKVLKSTNFKNKNSYKKMEFLKCGIIDLLIDRIVGDLLLLFRIGVYVIIMTA